MVPLVVETLLMMVLILVLMDSIMVEPIIVEALESNRNVNINSRRSSIYYY